MSEDITRKLLSKIRNLQENYNTDNSILLLESETKDTKSIAITDDPKFGTNVLTNQIEQFRSIVDSSAQFAEPNESDVGSSPLIYVPKKNKQPANLIFGGIIPSLKNMKFQFVLHTDSQYGCFIWTDGMPLTKDNVDTIQKLFGFYANWREEWNTEIKDLEKMASVIDSF
jgi:hypothetical protein